MTEDSNWIPTFSGGSFDLLRPTAQQVKLVDIAHHLSRVSRFTGATTGPLAWNVAQHSLLVERLLPEDSLPETRLHATLHDAHEAYVNDMTTPVQAALESMAANSKGNSFRWTWSALKTNIDNAIWQSFALVAPTQQQAAQIRLADLRALFIEKDQLLAPHDREWAVERPDMPDTAAWSAPTLHPTMPYEAKAMFIERVRYLVDLRHGIA